MRYIRVAVNVPTLSGEFDYHLPEELEGKVGPGHLVSVPFGRQTVQGVVLELVSQPLVADTKPALNLLDPLPVLTAVQLDLARRLSALTLNPLSAMIGLMLPAGLNQQADTLYSLRENLPAGTGGNPPSAVQNRLVSLLREKGSLRGRQIDRHFRNVDWRKTAQLLLRRGVLGSQSILPAPTVRPKYIRTAQLSVPPAQAEAALPDLGKTEATLTRRQAALRFLMREPAQVDVAWVYAESGCTLADLQELRERELITLHETEIWRDPLHKLEEKEARQLQPPELTPDQQAAWERIRGELQHPNLPILLQGVTGSGKTELYLRAAADALQQGREAIILVPEIAITPQTVRRFLERFPGQVGLVHSKLSPGERYDTWRRARLGLLKVIIGPRSALFTPLPNIGLIVVDECHDPSYSQAEPPFYNATSAACEYARLGGAVCLLGSATPSIVQVHQAGSGESLRVTLPRRIVNREMPEIQVVDMRAELKSGNRGIFSRPLQEALEQVLNRNEQAILFLNRRGTASYVFCRDCGYALKCPRCDGPLTLHLAAEAGGRGEPASALTCHHCGYRRGMPEKCPTCGGQQIRAYGLGSEKVEAEVKQLFPSARTLRWDWETTREKDAHEILLSHFAAHRADVLVGTQMLAKSLDLPLVTLVGIVLAEVGLNLPDPFAAERTFNLLTQVAGRAGRSSLGGRVVLQTFQPEHYVIQYAARHDVEGFHARELEERRRLGYPPFSRLLRLEYRHYQAVEAEAEARRMAARIENWIKSAGRRETTMIGPAPCFFGKLGGVYRWQILLRGPKPEQFINDLKFDEHTQALAGWRVETEPASLL